MRSKHQTTSERAGEQTIFGHPKGLFYLAFTEAWERFSFYGMTALVVLYMVNQLLLPGHLEHIAGLAGFRAGLESLVGPLSTQAFASQIYGLYAGFVYFTPLLGGLIADRWIGQRNAVVIGALSMSAGHLAMAFDQTFLIALLLLIIGSGFLKGNISAQVGALYPPNDEARRTRAFVIFSTGINVGAVAGPLLCGLLAQVYGWHYGFGVAAIFMLLGLGTYLYGYRYLPARVKRHNREGDQLTASDWRIIAVLVVVITITIFQSIGYGQIFNVMPVWTQQLVAPTVGSFRVPIPWYQSSHSLFSILAVPVLLYGWRRQAARGREPSEITKIGIGAWLMALSNLILAAATFGSGGAPINPIWPLLYCLNLAVSFMYYWPTLLALVSRTAPAMVNATMMGIAFISLFIANNLIGWIGGFYEHMNPVQFWAMHAAIAAIGGILMMLFGRRLNRALQPV
ncbi:MAG TPA: peptide MFS transporter [Candidatus Udaeobacter sp.]|jgi:POT family proton-dependent oligopeptide transporter